MSAPWMPPLPEMHGDESLLMDANELRQLQADAARAALEQAAKVCEPKSARPCDCTVCDCGNSGDRAAVIAWDTDKANADAIRALAKEITP